MEASSTDKRIDELADRVGRFEARSERFEDKVDARFNKVDARFDKLEERFEERFENLITKEQFEKANELQKERMDRIDARFDRWGKVVTGGTVTIVAAVILKAVGV